MDDTVRHKFGASGFAVVRGALQPKHVAALRAELERLIAADWPGCPRGDLFYQDLGDKATLKQVQQVHHLSPLFAAVGEEVCRPLAEALFESGQARLANAQFFNKPPGSRSVATPWHQDGYYFHIRPQSGAITFWVALDAVDAANGGLVYAEASHLGGLLKHHKSGVLGFSQRCGEYPPAPGPQAGEGFGDGQATNQDEGQHNDTDGSTEGGGSAPSRCLEFKQCATTAQPGDVIFHHSYTLHSAGANTTADRPRRALGFIFFDTAAQVDKDSELQYQARLRAQLVQEGKLFAAGFTACGNSGTGGNAQKQGGAKEEEAAEKEEEERAGGGSGTTTTTGNNAPNPVGGGAAAIAVAGGAE